LDTNGIYKFSWLYYIIKRTNVPAFHLPIEIGRIPGGFLKCPISIIIGMLLSLPLICFHKLSHALILKTLNKDSPIVHLLTLKPCCIPQKPIPLTVFKIDLLAPLWIIGVLGILLFVFTETALFTIVFILMFQILCSAKGLYWFYKLKNIPNDRYVICDGLSAIIYKNSN